MNFELAEEYYSSVRLKCFEGKDEAFVRENFLMPLFQSAGYDAFGSYTFRSGVRLTGLRDRYLASDRQHIYPDFVLLSRERPLWVVDAKSPKGKVDSKSNLRQISSYGDRLSCGHLMLSNAVISVMLGYANGVLHPREVFELHGLDLSRWMDMAERLSPERTVCSQYTFQQALNLYGTDDYIDRSFLMHILQSFDFQTIRTVLSEVNDTKTYLSDSFRNRALPAILCCPWADRDQGLFNVVTEFSLNDVNPVVRENYLTCVLASWNNVVKVGILDEALRVERETYLESLLHECLLKCSGVRRKEVHCSKSDIIGRYLALLDTKYPVSFPVALVVNKPRRMSYKRFVEFLKLYPGLVESIEDDPNTHWETRRVLEDCIRFARAKNANLHKLVLNSATKRQLAILKSYGA